VRRPQTYLVTAGRGTGGYWVFQCAKFPRAISRGRSLADAYDLMPAEIAAVAGVCAASVDIDLVPDCTVVQLDEAQATLPDLVAETAGHEIYLTRNHEAVAVLVASESYERLVDQLKQLEESLARVRNSPPDAVRTFTPAVYEN
jgi:antitoxin (DNA-binding transcriptional repressor) of toxin-antitoxin stability system